MRVRLEAAEGELETKGIELIKALIAQVAPVCPELAATLAKALPEKHATLRYPALRGLHHEATRTYEELLTKMIAEIAVVIDGGQQHEDHTERIADGAPDQEIA